MFNIPESNQNRPKQYKMSKLKMYIPSGDELLKYFVHFVKDNIFGAELCINKQRGTI